MVAEPTEAVLDAFIQDHHESYAKCCLEGLRPGDYVPYGSTTAQLPTVICECVYDAVDEAIERGELVLNDQGKLEAI